MSGEWQPGSSRATLERRACMLRELRAFFAERAVMEVETPILGAAGATDPQIESLHLRIGARPERYWLHTSPEFAMKRLLAAGSGDIYQVCKVFRDAEIGRWHNPEFTMLEWYRLDFDDHRLMDEVEELVRRLLAPERTLPPSERLSYRDAVLRFAGVDIDTASDADLAMAAERHDVLCDAALDRDGRLDLLMAIVAGPHLGTAGPCFVHDYPASQASLARLKPPARAGLPAVAARFELYLDGLELANGFHELGDAQQQRQRFEHDLATRREHGLPLPPLDERLLAALNARFPDCAGVALGLDRLLAIASRAHSLAEVLSFDIDHA